jgi:hypothetical protein
MTEAWTFDRCKEWIRIEVLSGKTTWEKFLQRISAWQTQQYKQAAYPESLAYCDQSLLNIQKAAEELGIFDEKPKKKSTIFDAVKGQEDIAS